MPSGVYKRKPGLKRHISDETKEKFRANLQKVKTPENIAKAAAASLEARQKTAPVRLAKTILKYMPAIRKPGDRFRLGTNTKLYEIIDTIPVPSNGGQYEQKLIEHNKGLSRACRLVWDHKPGDDILVGVHLEI